MRQMQRTNSQVSRWQEGAAEGPAPPTPSTLAESSIGTCPTTLLYIYRLFKHGMRTANTVMVTLKEFTAVVILDGK